MEESHVLASADSSCELRDRRRPLWMCTGTEESPQQPQPPAAAWMTGRTRHSSSCSQRITPHRLHTATTGCDSNCCGQDQLRQQACLTNVFAAEERAAGGGLVMSGLHLQLGSAVTTAAVCDADMPPPAPASSAHLISTTVTIRTHYLQWILCRQDYPPLRTSLNQQQQQQQQQQQLQPPNTQQQHGINGCWDPKRCPLQEVLSSSLPPTSRAALRQFNEAPVMLAAAMPVAVRSAATAAASAAEPPLSAAVVYDPYKVMWESAALTEQEADALLTLGITEEAAPPVVARCYWPPSPPLLPRFPTPPCWRFESEQIEVGSQQHKATAVPNGVLPEAAAVSSVDLSCLKLPRLPPARFHTAAASTAIAIASATGVSPPATGMKFSVVDMAAVVAAGPGHVPVYGRVVPGEVALPLVPAAVNNASAAGAVHWPAAAQQAESSLNSTRALHYLSMSAVGDGGVTEETLSTPTRLVTIASDNSVAASSGDIIRGAAAGDVSIPLWSSSSSGSRSDVSFGAIAAGGAALLLGAGGLEGTTTAAAAGPDEGCSPAAYDGHHEQRAGDDQGGIDVLILGGKLDTYLSHRTAAITGNPSHCCRLRVQRDKSGGAAGNGMEAGGDFPDDLLRKPTVDTCMLVLHMDSQDGPNESYLQQQSGNGDGVSPPSPSPPAGISRGAIRTPSALQSPPPAHMQTRAAVPDFKSAADAVMGRELQDGLSQQSRTADIASAAAHINPVVDFVELEQLNKSGLQKSASPPGHDDVSCITTAGLRHEDGAMGVAVMVNVGSGSCCVCGGDACCHCRSSRPTAGKHPALLSVKLGCWPAYAAQQQRNGCFQGSVNVSAAGCGGDGSIRSGSNLSFRKPALKGAISAGDRGGGGGCCGGGLLANLPIERSASTLELYCAPAAADGGGPQETMLAYTCSAPTTTRPAARRVGGDRGVPATSNAATPDGYRKSIVTAASSQAQSVETRTGKKKGRSGGKLGWLICCGGSRCGILAGVIEKLRRRSSR